MSDIIISAENIGKRYVLNHQSSGGGYRKFSDTLIHAAKAPLRLFGKRKTESEKLQTKEDFWALKDVSFDIKQGEVVGIIGRNGAGKSTLLKILSRITEPTTGRITLRGRVASLLEVGTGFHPELTGRENVFLNGAILGMRKEEIKSKFDEIVAFAEIEKFLDTPVKRYSSGMYVRLAFAVAAHLEPEILIVDEVLAVGDAQFQAKCLGKMQDVAKGGGRTVLFVSHNMGAVKSLCRTGLLMSHGQVLTAGSIDCVVDAYLSQPKGSRRFTPKTSAVSHVTGCEIRNTNGISSSMFFTNEEIQVVLRYRSERTISGLRCGFRVSTIDGTVLACFTPEDEGAVTPNSKGEYEARAVIPANTFLKGVHQLSASVWNGSTNEIYDDVVGLAELTFEAARGRAYLSEFTRPGLFQSAATWSFEKPD
jgi:lipopolysaccharide transport system ATP-binding protein